MVDCYFDIETTGLNPYKDHILTIQFKKQKDIVLWELWEEENEACMILKFLEYLRGIGRNDSIYGYNTLKFDVPFITARLHTHGLLSNQNYSVLYKKKWIDLYQYLGDNYVSMDKWLFAFDIKRRCRFTGRDVPSFYEQKRYDDIREHAVDDVLVCEELSKKIFTFR